MVLPRAFQLETPLHDMLSADGERYAGGICQVWLEGRYDYKWQMYIC
jgi:hypothetical protein